MLSLSVNVNSNEATALQPSSKAIGLAALADLLHPYGQSAEEVRQVPTLTRERGSQSCASSSSKEGKLCLGRCDLDLY